MTKLSRAETLRIEKAMHESAHLYFLRHGVDLEKWDTIMKPIFDWLAPIRKNR